LLVDFFAACLLVDLIGFLDGDEDLGEVGKDGEFLIGLPESGGNGDEVIDFLLDLVFVAGDDVLDFQEVRWLTLFGQQEGGSIYVLLLDPESQEEALLDLVGEDLDNEANKVDRQDSKYLL
jgi:hypothetical protein